jgi:hypothetical protein
MFTSFSARIRVHVESRIGERGRQEFVEILDPGAAPLGAGAFCRPGGGFFVSSLFSGGLVAEAPIATG